MTDAKVIDTIHSAFFYDMEFKEKELVWDRIVQKIAERKRKRILLRNISIGSLSVAAMLCLMLTFYSQVNLDTLSGKMAYKLPDGTEVTLSKGASLKYNRISWMFSRQVNLTGDASFHVTKGNPFMVKFPMGSVTVLGTRFFIDQEKDDFMVSCTEGSVKVATAQGDVILNSGEKMEGGGSDMKVSKIKKEYPEYLEYDDVSLSEVLKDLEDVYEIEVPDINAFAGQRFSGFLTTKNRDEALGMLFEVCGMQYRMDGDRLIINK